MIIIVLIIGIIMGMMNFENVVSGEEMALMKLREKYGEEFVVERIQNLSFQDNEYTAIVYALEDPGTMFAADISFDGSVFYDNRVSKKVFAKISDIVGQNMDNLNGYHYIYSYPLVEAKKLDNLDMSVEEYLELFPNRDINVYVHYAPDKLDAEALYENIMNSFNGLGEANGMIYLSIVDEGQLDAVQDYLESNDRIYDDYKRIVGKSYKGNIRVKKGHPEIDLVSFKKMLGE